MPGRAGVFVVLCAVAVGQAADPPRVSVPARWSAVSLKPADLPPLSVPAVGEPAALPNGTPVSQPLRPTADVEVLSSPPTPPSAEVPPQVAVELAEVQRPLGRSWHNLELLFWWPKPQPLPPLVTTARGQSPAVFGGPNTSLLVGNQSIDSPDVAGGRFTLGFAVNPEETAGLAVTYFFLGSRTSSVSVGDAVAGRGRSVARPVIDPLTGDEAAVAAAVPGQFEGVIDAATTTRVTGWEVSGIVNLFAGPRARVSAVTGYRYFMVNEGLRIDQTTLYPAGAGPAVLASAADQFDAHTRFHGGQLGLTADLTRGPVFLELAGKVGLGQAVAVVRVSGQSVAVSPGFPPAISYFPGGVLAQPTNTGRWVRSGFAVLPEGTVKLGYRLADRSRMYVGYNFLYLSEAVRPGEQIDRTVDLAQVPLIGQPGTPGAERPAPLITRSDFWVQGLMFGLEYRY